MSMVPDRQFERHTNGTLVLAQFQTHRASVLCSDYRIKTTCHCDKYGLIIRAEDTDEPYSSVIHGTCEIATK